MSPVDTEVAEPGIEKKQTVLIAGINIGIATIDEFVSVARTLTEFNIALVRTAPAGREWLVVYPTTNTTPDKEPDLELAPYISEEEAMEYAKTKCWRWLQKKGNAPPPQTPKKQVIYTQTDLQTNPMSLNEKLKIIEKLEEEGKQVKIAKITRNHNLFSYTK